MGELGCPEAYDVLTAIARYDGGTRAVRVPEHKHVCWCCDNRKTC